MSHMIVADDVSQADIDQLCAKLAERSWEKVFTVLQLRRHLKHYEVFRRILSSLWLAVIHLSVQQSSAEIITTELIRAKEVGQKGPKEIMSKYCRAGRASWRVLSRLGSGVLAAIDLAEPISETSLDGLLRRMELSVDEVIYRPHVRKVFDYLVAFLEEKQSTLLELFTVSIGKVSTEVRKEQPLTVDDFQSVGRSSHEQPLPVDLPSVYLEMAFNKNTHRCHIVPYESEIFRRITFGDLTGTRRLLFNQQASIYDVDPFGLPLLYYAAYYCMRARGVFEALEMCNMLTNLGADIFHPDEVGNTPLDILADCCVAARSDNNALAILSSLCGKGIAELTEDHAASHGFRDIHRALLGLRPEDPQLEEYLQYLHPQTLAEFIDKPDFHGRSALVYAVEYGWSDAVETLVKFGANVHQLRSGDRKGLTLLHLLFAGPAQKTTVQIAKLLIKNGADVNIRDSEGWTPLHIAASWDNYIGMALLAAAGAQVTAQTFSGDTAVTLSTDPQLMTKYWYVLTQFLNNLPKSICK